MKKFVLLVWMVTLSSLCPFSSAAFAKERVGMARPQSAAPECETQ